MSVPAAPSSRGRPGGWPPGCAASRHSGAMPGRGGGGRSGAGRPQQQRLVGFSTGCAPTRPSPLCAPSRSAAGMLSAPRRRAGERLLAIAGAEGTGVWAYSPNPQWRLRDHPPPVSRSTRAPPGRSGHAPPHRRESCSSESGPGHGPCAASGARWRHSPGDHGSPPPLSGESGATLRK